MKLLWHATVIRLTVALVLVGLTACDNSEPPPARAPETAASGPAGSIAGSVRFSGTPPKLPTISFTGSRSCWRMHRDTPVKDRRVVVNDNGTLRNVFVYISRGAEGRTYDPPSEPVEILQKYCLFQPRVLGMIAGQSMWIKNGDFTLHNIRAAPDGSSALTFSQMPEKEHLLTPESDPPSFGRAGEIIPISCGIHGWMKVWVGVRPDPFFAVTGDDGTFSIRGVPPGTYTLTAWHEFYGNPDALTPTRPLTAEVVVAADKTAIFDFGFTAP